MNLKTSLKDLVSKAHFYLPKDVLSLLRYAYEKETVKEAKEALSWILQNARISRREKLAICQDTGLGIIFIEVGKRAKVSSLFIKEIIEAIEEGYRDNYLRTSLYEPLKSKKPSHKGIIVHLDFSLSFAGIKITLLSKGFGSENKSRLKMFLPTASWEEIEDFVVESVKRAGPEACPPFFVGVGIGGSADYALLLAKKSPLERLDKPNTDRKLAFLEERILKRINALKVGAMGFGGDFTALSVRIKTAPTHIGGLPVGINISCHALRKAQLKIKTT